jgi:hypothetical protein
MCCGVFKLLGISVFRTQTWKHRGHGNILCFIIQKSEILLICAQDFSHLSPEIRLPDRDLKSGKSSSIQFFMVLLQSFDLDLKEKTFCCCGHKQLWFEVGVKLLDHVGNII